MENRRLLLAAFLSALILIVWQMVFPAPPVQRPVTNDVIESAVDSEGSAATVETDDGELADRAVSEGAEAAEREAIPLREASHEQTVEIDTARAQAVFTNRGAQLLSYRLKEHITEGEAFDVVRFRGDDLYPFALIFDGRDSRAEEWQLNSALYEHELLPDGQGVVFRYSGPKGVAEKTFLFEDSGFMKVQVNVDEEDWGVLFGPSLGNDKGRSKYTQYLDHVVGYRQAGDLETLKAEKVDEDRILPAAGVEWVSLENNYFLVAAIPGAGVQSFSIRPVLQRTDIEEGRPRFLPLDTAATGDDLARELMVVALAEDQAMTLETYFGAKHYGKLSALPYNLESTVRWGTYLGVISKPLYILLVWIYANIIANFGWAIVLVTFMIRFVFFPLTHKSQKSMTKMQELNPKVQAIKAKYKSKLRDKQGRPNVEAQRQMNEEVMGTYRSAGVNPAAGCLPMLLQMPVFFAFYRLLTTAVELRGASWALWIYDLSSPDPYFVLPLVMGATSLFMQRMMPSSPDPMQKRLMQMMPIMFTAFAFFFPSGLVLYWMTNNMLTMAQQSLINRMKKK